MVTVCLLIVLGSVDENLFHLQGKTECWLQCAKNDDQHQIFAYHQGFAPWTHQRSIPEMKYRKKSDKMSLHLLQGAFKDRCLISPSGSGNGNL